MLAGGCRQAGYHVLAGYDHARNGSGVGSSLIKEALLLKTSFIVQQVEFKGPDALSGTVVEQKDKTYRCHGSSQTLTSTSDGVLCLIGIAQARFLSDTKHCPIVTSESVRRMTVRQNIPLLW